MPFYALHDKNNWTTTAFCFKLWECTPQNSYQPQNLFRIDIHCELTDYNVYIAIGATPKLHGQENTMPKITQAMNTSIRGQM